MRPDAAQAITTSELPGGTGPLGPVCRDGRARYSVNERQRKVLGTGAASRVEPWNVTENLTSHP